MSKREDERETFRRIGEEINKFHHTLIRLDFEKTKITNEITVTQDKLQILRDHIDQGNVSEKLLEQEEKDDTNITVGVEVRIRNPHGKQLDQGVVRSFTRDGLAQIHTSDGAIIRRLMKNLTSVKRHHSRY